MTIQELINELEKRKESSGDRDIRVRTGNSVYGKFDGIDRVEVGNRGVELVTKKEPIGA